MAFGLAQVFGLEKLPDIRAPTNRATQLILLGEIIRKSPKWRVLHIACNYSENGPIIKQITARRHFEREADVLLSLTQLKAEKGNQRQPCC